MPTGSATVHIAVDLLYDALEKEEGLEGIGLGSGTHVKQLKVAGYADDTAIYIAHKRSQQAAITTVHKCSAVSGLKLTVTKSAALNLVEEGTLGDSTNSGQGEALVTSQGADQEIVKKASSVRYLGHIAGTGCTMEAAWDKAFAALRARLVLAETKTKAVQQCAVIAAASIILKLMYVARHAWPSMDIAASRTTCGERDSGCQEPHQQGGFQAR